MKDCCKLMVNDNDEMYSMFMIFRKNSERMYHLSSNKKDISGNKT